MIRFLLALLALGVSTASLAKDVTPGQALAIARDFFVGRNRQVPSTPLRCLADNGDRAAYYVFNNPSGTGFVVVAGDDRAHAILGYSDQGYLDLDNAPAQVAEWLAGYAGEIAFIRANGTDSDEVPAAGDDAKYKPVAPLLGNTAWSQLEPYNLMTPCYVGTTHAATGCAATAMAQVMFYHKYPAQGMGQHSYKSGQYNLSLSVDFTQSVYDWDAMLPVYGDRDPEDSRMGVALLMRDCGYAIDMDYGAVSGAAPDAWPTALVEYFGYDRGLTNRYRANYALDEWNRIIRDEIDAGRPVFAGGFANSGGHAFVFDGYDEDGLIHVNWGWAGTSNGYFRTSALTPAIQGTGGADGGFNARQSMITGIRPAEQGSELTPELLSSEVITATPAYIEAGQKASLKLNGKLMNAGYCDIVADLGFGVYDSDNQLVLVIDADQSAVSIAKGQFVVGVTADDTDLGGLAVGQYRMYPIAHEHGGTHWTKVHDNNNSKPNFIKVVVTEDGIRFYSPVRFQLSASDLKVNNLLYQGIKASVTATLTNTGDMEYCGDVRVALYDAEGGGKVAESDNYIEEVYAQSSTDIDIVSAYNVAPGDYLLTLIDENESQLCQPVTVSVAEAPAGDNSVLASSQLSLDVDGPVYQDNISVTGQLMCQSGVYAANVVVYIYDEFETLASPYGSLQPQFVWIPGGGNVDVHFAGKMENGVPGTRYKATVVDLDNNVYVKPRTLASCYFTLADPTDGVDDIIDGAAGCPAVYDLSGRRMVGRQLAPGIYVTGGKKFVVR